MFVLIYKFVCFWLFVNCEAGLPCYSRINIVTAKQPCTDLLLGHVFQSHHSKYFFEVIRFLSLTA